MSSETSRPPPAPAAGTHANNPAAAAAPPPGRGFTVLTIAVTALLFAGMLTLLFYRWATNREPTSVIVVEGTPKFDGVDVTVDGVRLRKPYTATLSADRNYTLPFYLDKGFYTVHVTQRGRTVLDVEVEVDARQGKKLILAKHEHLLDPPTTKPQ